MMKLFRPNSFVISRRSGWLVLSLAIHLALLFGLGAVGGRVVGALPDSAISVQLVGVEPTAPLLVTPGVRGRAAENPSPQQAAKPPMHRPEKPVTLAAAPQDVRDDESTIESLDVPALASVADSASAIEGASAENAPPPPAASSPGGGDMRQALPLVRLNRPPDYPRIARQRGWQGDVMLWVKVDRLGRVERSGIESSSGFALLDRNALKAVRNWRFQPALRSGVPVESLVRVPVSFRLEKG